MKRAAWVLAIVITCVSNSKAADWKPAHSPLATRWAKDVAPERALPEYPRPQLVRPDWLNLNGPWQLAFAKEGETPPLGKDLPETILVPFPVESALSGIMKPVERVWYRRSFSVPKEWSGKNVLLHFGAVNWEAAVWVNGKKLDAHRGGYDGFSLDITSALKPDFAQELVVGVWNPVDGGTQPRGKQVKNPKGIWYTPCTGIWQTVWLEPAPAASIAGLVVTPDVAGGKVRITVQGRGVNAEHTASVTVQDKDMSVAKATGPLEKPIELPIPQAKLWSAETPFLYDLKVDLHQGDKSIDSVRSYFGMRQIALGKDAKGITRPLLNGQFVFQLGLLDQGFWPDGIYTAPTDEALKYDIEITKKLGFNLARKHVKVEPERWYYWCDRLGLLVWQDMPSGEKMVRQGQGEIKRSRESAEQYELELKRMIDGRRNHPCIIQWVPFNEGWGQYDTVRITQWVKDYDPSRLVDCASGWNDMPAGDVHDVHVYPGPGAPNPEPKRAAVLGEFGGYGLGVKGHVWSKTTWGYRGTNDSADLTRRYERLLRRIWELKDKPGLSAAVYTQTTDVETETNGLLTYDRAVIKADPERVAAVNRGDFSHATQTAVVIPTSQDQGQPWRYVFEKPADDWFKSDFNDAAWKEGPGGFGTQGTQGASVRTEWKSADIWLRRAFTLPEEKLADLHLLLHHDDDAEVYLNGVLAVKVSGYLTGYEEVPISALAQAAIKPGKNVFAVHCRQIKGGQYIDVGLVAIKDGKK